MCTTTVGLFCGSKKKCWHEKRPPDKYRVASVSIGNQVVPLPSLRGYIIELIVDVSDIRNHISIKLVDRLLV